MWPNIIGLFAGSDAAWAIRERDWKAEVARCERRQNLRLLQTPVVSRSPSLHEIEDDSQHSSLTLSASQSSRIKKVRFELPDEHCITNRRAPAPTCCPQEPGGHLRRRYMPWIAANHINCAVHPVEHSGQPEERVAESESVSTTASSSFNTTADTVTSQAPSEEEITDPVLIAARTARFSKLPRLAGVGRDKHLSSTDLRLRRTQIEAEIRSSQSLWGSRMLAIEDHPLVQEYNWLRNESIQAGEEEVPDAVTSETYEWSIENRMQPKPTPPVVYVDDNGTEVHIGFKGPPTIRRNQSYSNVNTFQKWQFSNAEVDLDTDLTRLKEYKGSNQGSTIKLVLSEARDTPVGTATFLQVNNAPAVNRRAIAKDFSRMVGKRAGSISMDPKAVLPDAKPLTTGCAIESDSESGEEDPDDLIISKPGQEVAWSDCAVVKKDIKVASRAKGKVRFDIPKARESQHKAKSIYCVTDRSSGKAKAEDDSNDKPDDKPQAYSDTPAGRDLITAQNIQVPKAKFHQQGLQTPAMAIKQSSTALDAGSAHATSPAIPIAGNRSSATHQRSLRRAAPQGMFPDAP